MSRRSTPKKAKEPVPCEDVEAEFCLRALSLFASLYGSPSTEEITTFPPPKSQKIPPPEKSIPFNSPIIDHRLRRNQEKRASTFENQSKLLSLQAERISEKLDSEDNDCNLEEIFAPEKATRTEKPKYILNEEMDRKIEQDKREQKPKPLDMKEIQKQFKARLEASKKRGKERSAQRKERLEETERQAMEQSQKLYQSKLPKDGRMTPERQKMMAKTRQTARMNYKTPEDYAKLVHKKSTNDDKYFYE